MPRISGTVSGLDPDTTYNFQVRVVDANGNPGDWSNVAQGTTLPASGDFLLIEATHGADVYSQDLDLVGYITGTGNGSVDGVWVGRWFGGFSGPYQAGGQDVLLSGAQVEWTGNGRNRSQILVYPVNIAAVTESTSFTLHLFAAWTSEINDVTDVTLRARSYSGGSIVRDGRDWWWAWNPGASIGDELGYTPSYPFGNINIDGGTETDHGTAARTVTAEADTGWFFETKLPFGFPLTLDKLGTFVWNAGEGSFASSSGTESVPSDPNSPSIWDTSVHE
jgi:hypothetical protein